MEIVARTLTAVMGLTLASVLSSAAASASASASASAVPAVALPASDRSSQAARIDSIKTARDLVDAFYAWYVPVAVKATREAAFSVAVRQKRSVLDEALAAALAADRDAQAKSPHELVGLDADPFLNSQDPCAGYAVGQVTARQGTFLVPVYAVCDGTRVRTPTAVVAVKNRRARWVIVDVFLGNGRDGLMARLAALAKERQGAR